jgi:hypothetical protein
MNGMSLTPPKGSKKKRNLSDDSLPEDYLQWLHGVLRTNLCDKEGCEPCAIRIKIAAYLLKAHRSKKSGNLEASVRQLRKALELLDHLVDNLEKNEAGLSLQLSLASYIQSVASYEEQADLRYQLGASLSYLKVKIDRTIS